MLKAIDGGRTVGGFTNPLAAHFYEMARLAERGEVIGVASVLVHADGGISHGWTGEHRAYATVGALNVLARQFADAKIEGIAPSS